MEAAIYTQNRTSKWTARQISILITIIALVLWSYSISHAKLNIGYFGLIDSLPISFFIALGLVTIASGILWISKENHNKLLCLQLCFIITALYLTPVLVGSNDIFASLNYRQFNMVDYITETGHLNPDAGVFKFHNWPGIYIFQSAFMQIFNMDGPDSIATLGAFIMQFLILLPLYLLFRNLIQNSNYIWAACYLFYVANWVGETYFITQGFAFFLFLSLLAILTRSPVVKEKTISIGNQIMAIIMMACLTITHSLTSIATGFSIIMIWLTRQFRDVNTNLVIIVIISVTVWSLYGAANYFDWYFPKYIEWAFRFDFLFGESVHMPGNPSASFTAVNNTRILFTALLLALCTAGILITFDFKNRRFKNKYDLTILTLIATPVIILASGLYEAEYFSRALLFVLVPICYFGVKLLKSRATQIILLMLLLIALPLHFIAHYGVAAYGHMPRGEIAYWHFISDNTTQGYLIGSQNLTIRSSEYPRYKYDDLGWDNELLVGDNLTRNLPQYVSAGIFDQRVYEFEYDDPQFIPEMKDQLGNSARYNLIYANPDLDLYIHETL